MSKLTFRADDDLVARVEELDASKSEVMREALRRYLDETTPRTGSREDTLDGFLARRVDELIEERLDARTTSARDVDVNVTIEGTPGNAGVSDAPSAAPSEPSHAKTGSSDKRTGRSSSADPEATQCGQCGESIDAGHVYCPNCGEKRSGRVFCECGDELRTDWSFCPGCGRRTPAADVLDGP